MVYATHTFFFYSTFLNKPKKSLSHRENVFCFFFYAMKQYYYSFSIIMCVCVVHSSIVKMLRIWLVCNKLFEFVWHHDFFFIFFFFCYVRHFENIFFWCLNFFFKLITWLYIFKRVKVFDRVDQIPANYVSPHAILPPYVSGVWCHVKTFQRRNICQNYLRWMFLFWFSIIIHWNKKFYFSNIIE